MEISKTNYRRDLDEKFEKMCNAYYPSSMKRQFAVMWIGEEDYSKKAKGFDKTSQKGLLDKGDYYLAARFAGGKDYVERKPTGSDATDYEPPITKLKKMQFDNVNKHTEVVILENIKEYLDKITTAKPNLYLFSLYSPCCGTPPSETCPKGCSGKLKEWFGKNKGSVGTMTIAWNINYHPQIFPVDRHFLHGLFCILTEDEMKIKWRDTRYCPDSTKKRDWFQRDLFQCVGIEKEKEKVPTWYGCTTQANFNQDIATLINRITWQCGTRDWKVVKIDTGKTRFSSDPNCWEPKVNEFLTKTGIDFTDLKKMISECLRITQKRMVGPALDPQDPMKHSNEAKDVKGDPAQLCFEK